MPRRSCCDLGGGRLAPDFESVRPDNAKSEGCKLLSAGMEVTVDERVSGEEVLGLLGRLEPLHLPFPSSRRPMLVSRPWPAVAQAVSETRTDFLAPATPRLTGNNTAAFSHEQLDIPKTEAEDAEDVVQPHSVADDLGREPMTIVWLGWRLHAASLARLRASGLTWLP